MASLIFPHQLYEHHPALQKGRKVYLCAHPLFFHDKVYPVNFHKMKLVLHVASLKAYHKKLLSEGFHVEWIEHLKEMKADKIITCELTDFILEKRLKELKIPIQWVKDPGFLSPIEFLEDTLGDKKHYLMASFYMAQRKRMNILMQGGKPVGGKWSFDAENRKKMPSSVLIPPLPKIKESEEVVEAKKWVEKNFKNNLGSAENFFYPTTHKEAKKWLADFLEQRFSLYGEYQDALTNNNSYLFHSLLTPMLNIGLLTPDEVVQKALSYTGKVPLNSLEGFIRQVIGWREFMRGAYLFKGVEMRNSNFWKHEGVIKEAFYTGKTGIEPVDQLILRLNTTAYGHHIERLMVMGNLFFLLEIKPDEVYRWFMEYFIDAYDWVMVPNVYGMSQCSDGGSITTKPYFSGSNYLTKMSNYPDGAWKEIWDALFWRFVYKHQSFFLKNPRLSVMIKTLNKMNPDVFKKRLDLADSTISRLTKK